MSDKLNVRSVITSPLRVKGSRANSNVLGNHNIVRKPDKDNGAESLNFTLVGSPAPRSQIRTFISTNTLIRNKVKPTVASARIRDIDKHESSLENLYSFADNPTKYVQSSKDEKLTLNLEFSDRSDESDNYYNSHNIAFGQNGEYRIPEYDHIRYLEFNRTNSHELNSDHSKVEHIQNLIIQGQKQNAERQSLHSGSSSNNAVPGDDRNKSQRNRISASSDSESGSSGSNHHKVLLGSQPVRAQKLNDSLTGGSKNTSFDCAINYKNTVNPMVEKFMLDTGQQEEGIINNPLCNGSLLSKNFVQALQSQRGNNSVENSSRTSPETSRTILSGTSSNDGTWHQHSLNSAYFASPDTEIDVDKLSSNTLKNLMEENEDAFKEEKEQYLTVIRNEEVCDDKSSMKISHPYIFITDEAIDTEVMECSRSFSVNYSENPENNSTLEINKPDDSCASDNNSDYGINMIFPENNERPKDRVRIPPSDNTQLHDAISGYNGTRKKINHNGVFQSVSCNDSRTSVFYMTAAEITQAAEYTKKLSDLFTVILQRPPVPSPGATPIRLANCMTKNLLPSQTTPRIVRSSLGSPNFRTNHSTN